MLIHVSNRHAARFEFVTQDIYNRLTAAKLTYYASSVLVSVLSKIPIKADHYEFPLVRYVDCCCIVAFNLKKAHFYPTGLVVIGEVFSVLAGLSVHFFSSCDVRIRLIVLLSDLQKSQNEG